MRIESYLPRRSRRLTFTVVSTVCIALVCSSVACVAAAHKAQGQSGVPSWAKVSGEQIAAAKKLGIPVAFANAVGVKFVLVPPGEFMMGSPDDEVGRYPEEGPQHKVTMGKACYISIRQTTQGQWKKIMGTTPWEGKKAVVNNPAHAVNHVTWDDAMAFCAKLKEKDARSYRLPTEAEWEYACRAGSTTRYCYGDDLKAEKLGEYAWYLKSFMENEDQRHVHKVGVKKPNNWGIHDMHGNAWEFCMDTMHKNYEGAPTDGGAWIKDGIMREDGVSSRVVRGGGLRSTDRRVRTASRYSKPQNCGIYYVGFRVVAEVKR